MKKEYAKPTLMKRQQVTSVTAFVASPGDLNGL